MTFHEATDLYLAAKESKSSAKFNNSQKRRELTLLTHVLSAIGDMELSEVHDASGTTTDEVFRKLRAGSKTNEDFMEACTAVTAVTGYHLYKLL